MHGRKSVVKSALYIAKMLRSARDAWIVANVQIQGEHNFTGKFAPENRVCIVLDNIRYAK